MLGIKEHCQSILHSQVTESWLKQYCTKVLLNTEPSFEWMHIRVSSLRALENVENAQNPLSKAIPMVLQEMFQQEINLSQGNHFVTNSETNLNVL